MPWIAQLCGNDTSATPSATSKLCWCGRWHVKQLAARSAVRTSDMCPPAELHVPDRYTSCQFVVKQAAPCIWRKLHAGLLCFAAVGVFCWCGCFFLCCLSDLIATGWCAPSTCSRRGCCCLHARTWCPPSATSAVRMRPRALDSECLVVSSFFAGYDAGHYAS